MSQDNRKCLRCAELVKFDATVCKHCGHEFTAEELASAKAEKSKKEKRSALGCLFTVIGLAILVVTCSLGPPKPTSVQAANPNISEVEVYEQTKHANVRVDFGEIWSEGQIPSSAARVVEAVGKVMKAGAEDVPPSTETITFVFTGPTLDRYGNSDRSKVLQITLKTTDLRQVNYDNIIASSMLEYAKDIGFAGGAGRSAAVAYCKDHIGDNPRFCAEAFN